jgi:hypothetical protein
MTVRYNRLFDGACDAPRAFADSDAAALERTPGRAPSRALDSNAPLSEAFTLS